MTPGSGGCVHSDRPAVSGCPESGFLMVLKRKTVVVAYWLSAPVLILTHFGNEKPCSHTVVCGVRVCLCVFPLVAVGCS